MPVHPQLSDQLGKEARRYARGDRGPGVLQNVVCEHLALRAKRAVDNCIASANAPRRGETRHVDNGGTSRGSGDMRDTLCGQRALGR